MLGRTELSAFVSLFVAEPSEVGVNVTIAARSRSVTFDLRDDHRLEIVAHQVASSLEDLPPQMCTDGGGTTTVSLTPQIAVQIEL